MQHDSLMLQTNKADQFMASLASQTEQFNLQANAMAQFNTSEQNRIEV